MTDHRVPNLATLLLIAIISITASPRPGFAQGAAEPPATKTAADTPPDTPPDAAPADPEPEKPQPIAAADIAPQAEESSARLREVNKLAEPAQNTTDIAEKLPGTTEEIGRLVRDVAAAPPVSLRGVSAARQHWTGLDDLFAGWQKTLQKRSASLQVAHDELVSQQVVWQATQSEELPENVLEQINAVLSDIESTQAAVAERMKDVLTLQGQVSKQRDSTSKALARLDEIEASQRSSLFVRDQDPLWRAFGRDAGNLGSEFSESQAAVRAALSEFFARYKTNVAAQLATFIILLTLIWVTRSAVSAGTMSDEELERTAIVLARPFSTALLISMLIIRFVYPIASPEIIQIGRVIVLVPILRLLPRLLPKLRWVFVILSVVYLMETAGQLAVEGSLVQRLILLAATTLAIAALGAGLAKVRRQKLFEKAGMQRAVSALGWLGLIGVGLSLAANIYGTMALAILLSTAAFNALWMAIVLRVALNVLSALFMLVLRSPAARTLPSVRNCSEIIFRRVVSVLVFGGVILWFVFVLGWLQLAQPIRAWGEAAIVHEWTVGTLQISVMGVASFVMAIVIAVIVSRLVRFFLQEDVLSRLSLPRGAPATISTLVHYTIIGIGVVIAFAASGMELSSLGFIVGALSVGIGFGLQNVVNNFVSGLILIFERPVKVGDLIELPDGKGHVTRIGARSSTMKTFAGAEVIVPNGNLISSTVTNWTLSDQKRRTEVLVPTPRDSDPRRIIEILETVAAGIDDVLDDPAPYAACQGFDESGMIFALRAWPRIDASIIQVETSLLAGALEALREAGIEVPRPQRDVRVRRDEDGGSS